MSRALLLLLFGGESTSSSSLSTTTRTYREKSNAGWFPRASSDLRLEEDESTALRRFALVAEFNFEANLSRVSSRFRYGGRMWEMQAMNDLTEEEEEEEEKEPKLEGREEAWT